MDAIEPDRALANAAPLMAPKAAQQEHDPQLMHYIVAHQANNSWVESLSSSSFEDPAASAFITTPAGAPASPSAAVPPSAYDCNFNLPPAADDLLYEPHNVLPSATLNHKNNPYLEPSDFHQAARSPFRELQRRTSQPLSACGNVRGPDWVPASEIFQPSPLHDHSSSAAAAASRLQQHHPLAFAQPVFQNGQYSANYGLFHGGNMMEARPFHQRSSTNFQAGTIAHGDECAVQLNGPAHPAGLVGDGQWGSYQRSVIGKSQSMRALYEENAALRRALQSIRDQGLQAAAGAHVLPCASVQMSPAHLFQQPQPQQLHSARCIIGDAAEGRTLSMRERGRWGMPPEAQLFAAAGEWPAGCHCSAWAVMQAAASSHQHQQCCWYGNNARGHVPTAGHGRREAAADDEDEVDWGEGARVRTLKEQMEAAKEAAALRKTNRQERKAGAEEVVIGRRRRGRVRVRADATRGNLEEEEEAVAAAKAAEEELGRCAMCGGVLFQEAVMTDYRNVQKKQLAGGLPLRLCPACHPSAEDVAACGPSKHAPSTAPSGRHRAATSIAVAISLACKPGTAAAATSSSSSSSSSSRKKSKSRNIVDLCRQLVGLTTAVKPP